MHELFLAREAAGGETCVQCNNLMINELINSCLFLLIEWYVRSCACTCACAYACALRMLVCVRVCVRVCV
jgi:hypothetical protein